MRNLSRRRFVGAAAATCAVPLVYVSKGYAAEFQLKYANNSPVTHPLNIFTTKAIQGIKAETGGAVEIEIFPNNQLGGDTAMLSQLREGSIDFFTLSGLILSTVVPAASINGIGFAWKDYDTVWKGMDGALGTYVRGQIQKAGLYAFEKMWDNGYRQVTTSTKPIKGPDDLKGLKIRVPPSPLWTSMFKAFGSAPASINFSEVYSALQTKVVEGQENPLAIIKAAKLYEVQKYLSETNHMWDGFWMLANAKSWGNIPDKYKTVISKHFNQAAVEQRAEIFKQNNSLQAELEKAGMQFNKVDPAPFRDALIKAGFYKEWQGKYGAEAWAILEKVTTKLG
jgi:tripartite ATP-independent transporter DctP family solute receptor